MAIAPPHPTPPLRLLDDTNPPLIVAALPSLPPDYSTPGYGGPLTSLLAAGLPPLVATLPAAIPYAVLVYAQPLPPGTTGAPSWRTLATAYHALPHDARKRCAAVTVVHPPKNGWARAWLAAAAWLASPKFFRKLRYAEKLRDVPLAALMRIGVPAAVLAHDQNVDPHWVARDLAPRDFAQILPPGELEYAWSPLHGYGSEIGVHPHALATPAPFVVVRAARAVLRGCHLAEGVFRVIPATADADAALAVAATPTHVWPPEDDAWMHAVQCTAHVQLGDAADEAILAANLLAKWLRALPHAPLDDVALEAIQQFRRDPQAAPTGVVFPTPHLHLSLALVCAVLRAVARHRELTQMPAASLARVVAASLVRSDDPNKDMLAVADADGDAQWCVREAWLGDGWRAWFGGSIHEEVVALLGGVGVGVEDE